MGRICVFLAFVGLASTATAQKSDFFRMPEGARPHDYSRSYVLAKVKADHMTSFASAGRGGRVANPLPSSTGAIAVHKLVSAQQDRAGRGMRGPLKPPSIDITRYVKVYCSPESDIEKFINDLYATGHFDVVEPDYVNRRLLTPNDPEITRQYYLTNIKAFEGWDQSTGSQNIVIAIVDAGGDMDHPDLAANYWVNPNDPQNGINDDQATDTVYFDDFQGWDFIGNDTLNINNPDFIGDNNVNITNAANGHGVSVAGCASGRVNNATGIAGVGLNAKLMITKHTADNQTEANAGIFRAYEGVLYAAAKGANIINLSWGGSFKSQIAQDIMNYVTDLGCLVVAAAGNDGSRNPTYPAAYDNVLSVAATTQTNAKASFSSYGSTVDISAPGRQIFTTNFNNAYTQLDGTSFSSPIAAGAAALVWGKNPTFTPQQVAEQLRISADANTLYAANPTYIGKLGYGLLDIKNALTLSSPAIRASNPKLLSALGTAAEPGQPAFLTMTFTNVLKSTSAGIEITVSSPSSYMVISKSTIKPGIIGDNTAITNKLTPFEVTVSPNTPENTQIDLTITYKDGAYSDYQVVSFLLNPSYIDINQNLVTTTVSGIGRIGYEDSQLRTRVKGSGFVYADNSLLYEMGVMMGTSTADLLNNVRSTGTNFDQDFVSTTKIKQILPGTVSTSEVFGAFSNSATPANQKVVVNYRSYVWKDSPYEKFVIMEYKISNPTANPINGFRFGLFADWDITTDGQQDAAEFDVVHKLGYVLPKTAAAKPFAGIQLLTPGPANHYAIDNDQAIPGNPFGLYDGYTDAEKITSLSTARAQAGQTRAAGNDVSHVMSSGPHNIPAGQQITIAFALHGGANLDELVTSSLYADSVYNYTLNAPVPAVTPVEVCYNDVATLDASGASTLKWYKTFTGGTSFFTGAQFVTPALKNDTVFYVSNAEHTYESVRTPAHVTVKANPKIITSGSTTFCDGESITLSVAAADSYSWSTGETTQSITVSTANTFSVTVGTNSPSCTSNSDPVTTVVNIKPVSDFLIGTTGTLETGQPISFTNQSVDAASYFWEFGDNTNSTLPDPTHTYTKGKAYTVKLTVNAADGCQDVSQQDISVITGIEYASTGTQPLIYPNPFSTSFEIQSDPLDPVLAVRITDVIGRTLFEAPVTSSTWEGQSSTAVVSPGALPEGLYVVWMQHRNHTVTKKVVKAN